MWWFNTICCLICPIIMIIGGYFMKIHTPKKINDTIGYRTDRSMKNMDTWIYAHKYIGRLWMIFGAVVIIPSVIANLPFLGSEGNTHSAVMLVVIIVQTVILLVPIFMTENALKEKFDDNGNLR